MPTQLNEEMLQFKFPLISFSELDYRIFLKSNKPEEVILSILANFKEEDPENALKQIINRIEQTTEGNLSLSRYFNQLRVLAQLRNLELKLKNAMDSIANYIKEERDVLYLRGQEKEQVKFVKNLLTDSDFTIDKIAKIAGVAVEFVKSVQRQLSGK